MTSSNIKSKPKIGLINNGYEEFLTYKDIRLVSVYIMSYVLLSLDILPIDIVLLLITGIFLIGTLKSSFIMYLFFVLWENVTVFSFGITLSLVFQVLLVIKILISAIRNHKVISFNYTDLLYLLIIFFYGIMNYLIGTGTLSGIGLSFDVFIALYGFSIYREKEHSGGFWKSAFFTLMVSTFIALFYGFLNNTSLDRWIRTMGYVKQIYGTVGTARMGMYLCGSLIYPVFYIKNKTMKIILSLVISIFAIATYSITTLVCLFVFWTVVIIFKDSKNYVNNAVRIFLGVLCIIMLFLLWEDICEINLIKPLAIRVESMVMSFKKGDIKTATSTRAYLIKAYMHDFKEYPLFKKFFGSFYVNRYPAITEHDLGIEQYAHNSFIDILLYMGIFGFAMFTIKILIRIGTVIKSREFLPVFILKTIFLLTGLSVSMLTGSYWTIWMLL